MSIGINTNYGNYNYAGVNNAEPSWAKDDEKDEKKESAVNQQGAVYEKTATEKSSKEDDSKAIYKKSADVDCSEDSAGSGGCLWQSYRKQHVATACWWKYQG